jgi:hypothetical protein
LEVIGSLLSLTAENKLCAVQVLHDFFYHPPDALRQANPKQTTSKA